MLESIAPLIRGPLNEVKRLASLLEAHGIESELFRPQDINLGK